MTPSSPTSRCRDGGLALLAEIRSRRPDAHADHHGHGENDLVVGALRGGACDFIHKPIDRAYLIAAVRRAVETRDASRRVREQRLALERHLSELEAIVEVRTRKQRETHKVSESPWSVLERSTGPMEEVVQQIRRVADSPLTVLIQGETGTGKDLVARAIHQLSARRDKPFVAVDCGAIPDTLIESELFGYEKGAFTGAHERKEGQFQLAEGGTLFLDEIVNLPLRRKQSCCARSSNATAASQQAGGSGRRAITVASNFPSRKVRLAGFARCLLPLNEFVITLPPLRERDDILQLANGFSQSRHGARAPVPEISEAAAQSYCTTLAGNVRELRNVIRRAMRSLPT